MTDTAPYSPEGLSQQEYQRRLRNVFGQVRSITRRSKDTAETMDEFVQHLESRLDALLRSQAMALSGVPVALDEVVMEALLAFDLAQDERLQAEGEDVVLAPALASLLGLTMQELVMHSLFYGALSGPDGSVDMRWSHGGDEGELEISWKETGRGLQGDRQRFAFARDLICEMLPYEIDARVDLDHGEAALECHIHIPSSQFDGRHG